MAAKDNDDFVINDTYVSGSKHIKYIYVITSLAIMYNNATVIHNYYA